MSRNGLDYVLAHIDRVRKILPEKGYKDSVNKPGLFYKASKGDVYFVDTRPNVLYSHGQMNPRLWIRSKGAERGWKTNRRCDELVKNESIVLRRACVNVEVYQGEHEDGYCRICKSDFQSDGFLCPSCSDRVFRCNVCGKPIKMQKILDRYDWVGDILTVAECCRGSFHELCDTDHTEEVMRMRIGSILSSSPFCEVCGNKIVEKVYLQEMREAGLDISFLVEHHINYAEDRTITICQSCHSRIHHSNDPEFNKYLPPDKRPRKETRKEKKEREGKEREKKRLEESKKRCSTCRYLGDDCDGAPTVICTRYRYSDTHKRELGIPIVEDTKLG